MMLILCIRKIFRTIDALHELKKIKYSLSIVPYYAKKYNIKDDPNFCNQISSLLNSTDGDVELTLHGLYHQVDGQMDDFDTHTKEEEKNEIQQGFDIFSAVNLPRPLVFIPPAWHLSHQALQALKELDFSVSESMTELDFIQKGRKYLVHPVMNWDQQGDKEKNEP